MEYIIVEANVTETCGGEKQATYLISDNEPLMLSFEELGVAGFFLFTEKKKDRRCAGKR